MEKKILLVDNNNFLDFPPGGTLSFDKQLLKAIPPERVALVGTTRENIKIGTWTTLTIEGREYEFFPIARVSWSHKKPFLPRQLTATAALLFYLRRIRHKHAQWVFTQTPHFLFALRCYPWDSLCFYFAGVGNRVATSRYRYLRFLGQPYEQALLRTLRDKTDVILAAADDNAIQDLIRRGNGVLPDGCIRSFPTRFDSRIFHPLNKSRCREALGLSPDKTILVSVGRLCWIKGWDLLLDMMREKGDRDFVLVFVGDGEDREHIEGIGADLLVREEIRITGFLPPGMVAQYLGASDLVLVASYQEGWSTAMVEALACGKPLVSTPVSGAADLIQEERNGYILYDRDPAQLLALIDRALGLEDPGATSTAIARKYALDHLWDDLQMEWPQIRQKHNLIQ